jgi:hypothetical protein
MDKKLKELQKLWYKKLAQKGFKDIEMPDGTLKGQHLTLGNTSQVWADSVQEYYEAARALNDTNYIVGVKDRTIWRRHSNGETMESIAKKMGMERRSIQRVIHEIERRYILPKRR